MTAVRDVLALTAFLDERIATPFAWGRSANDCVSFAAAAVEAQGGDAQLGDLDWTDEDSAAEAIASLADPETPPGEALEAALDARFDRIPPAMAKRGDIGAIDDQNGPFGIQLFIVEGLTLVGPGVRGARRVRRSALVAAWSALPGDADV